MRYGSEYRTSIAATIFRITKLRDYRLAFRDKGKPTIITCDLPADIVDERDKAELIAKIIVVAIESRADTQYQHYPFDFTIELEQPVKPEWIVTHAHPEGVKYPLMRDLI